MVAELLNVDKGVTALLGGGGKTTLLYALADELCSLGTVILCTSTHIRVPEQYPLVTGGAAGIGAATVRRLTRDGCAVTFVDRDAAGVFGKYGGVCFETQHFPNSPNEPSFPSCAVKAGEVFTSVTKFAFSRE